MPLIHIKSPEGGTAFAHTSSFGRPKPGESDADFFRRQQELWAQVWRYLDARSKPARPER